MRADNLNQEPHDDQWWASAWGGSAGLWVQVHDDQVAYITDKDCSRFHVQNANSGMCLVARVGSGELPVKQVPCAGYADQDWAFDAPFYPSVDRRQIRNVLNSLCVVTRGAGESRAVATGCNSQYADQVWYREYDSGFRGFRLRNANSNACLVVRGGTPETQAGCGPWADQIWRLY